MYWTSRPANETMADYACFNFGWESEWLITQAVEAIEAGAVQRALDLMRLVYPSMTVYTRTSWRWRILYLRAMIDAAVRNGTGSVGNARVLNESFAELDRTYFVERDCCP
jgi:hypothetical protein